MRKKSRRISAKAEIVEWVISQLENSWRIRKEKIKQKPTYFGNPFCPVSGEPVQINHSTIQPFNLNSKNLFLC